VPLINIVATMTNTRISKRHVNVMDDGFLYDRKSNSGKISHSPKVCAGLVFATMNFD
jgi:hypothetical protein